MPVSRTRLFLGAATLIALVATASSLYLSLGIGLTPCHLCWYQRILMYPLVIILGVAAYERRETVWRVALPLSIIGFSIASYHSYLQFSTGACSFGGCSAVLYTVAGFSIPNLSAIAFASIILALGALRAPSVRRRLGV